MKHFHTHMVVQHIHDIQELLEDQKLMRGKSQVCILLCLDLAVVPRMQRILTSKVWS